jgi:hypothetical protein
MLFGIDLNLIIMLVIVVIFGMIIFKFIKGLTVNIYKKRERIKVDPTSTGERLKKYLIQAAKMNPRTVKYILLERTQYGEGGKIAKVVGHLTDKDCTTFIIKKHFFNKKQLLYCPVNMHTVLHQKTAVIRGASISSAGGYLWVVPTDEYDTKHVFFIVATAFEKDLKRMMTMDIPQIEVEQIYEGITGFDRDESFLDEETGIKEPFITRGDEDSEE